MKALSRFISLVLLLFLWCCTLKNSDIKIEVSNMDTFQNVILETECLLNKLPVPNTLLRAKYYKIEYGNAKFNNIIISEFEDFTVQSLEHNRLFNNFSLAEKIKLHHNIIYLYKNHIYGAV